MFMSTGKSAWQHSYTGTQRTIVQGPTRRAGTGYRSPLSRPKALEETASTTALDLILTISKRRQCLPYKIILVALKTHKKQPPHMFFFFLYVCQCICVLRKIITFLTILYCSFCCCWYFLFTIPVFEGFLKKVIYLFYLCIL